MTPNELIFSLAGLLTMIGWIPALFFPAAPFTRTLVHKGLIPAILALTYGYLISRFSSDASGGFGSLAEVKELFNNEGLLLAGWLHYLCFDLLIGARVGLEAHHKGYSKVWVVPAQILILMAGPIGWITYTAADRLHTARATR
ncbi:MAG: DUF4281 domain-containing protein [Bacteroidetes bacterium]|nr:DUF4281 domain-containing protein [Bacteroidota bacterium]